MVIVNNREPFFLSSALINNDLIKIFSRVSARMLMLNLLEEKLYLC